ncbi:guanine nucleotide-binding protein alpha-4 subunit [Mycena alexandri]|uniref:Guanine nucleotide-binding protein alpha-4 subunit n=1 Tax=Mycena alexandri TaxID=1745969 RepID=A0AAD6SVL7_9AGAR|nr:guanine nucleotide-binding protein alpha-4 subunit [Mycena alexandri]
MHTSDDPLDSVLRPPPDETPSRQRCGRRGRRRHGGKKRIVRLLLLGQSESGKSTTLRQFQRLYTPTPFREERILWRAVIQLNVLKSARTPAGPGSAASASTLALAAPNAYTAHAGPSSPSYHGADPYDAGYNSAGGYASPGCADFGGTSVPVFRNGVGDYAAGPSGALAYHYQLQQQMQHAQAQSQSRFANAPPPIPNGVRSSSPPGANGSGNTIPLDALKLALLPLRHVEALLIARLVPTAAGEEEPAYLPGSTLASTSTGEPGDLRVAGREVEGFGCGPPPPHALPSPSSASPPPSDAADAQIQPTLHACFPAMHALWADPGVREVLRTRKVRVEEGPGLFLDDLERVTGPRYLPTDGACSFACAFPCFLFLLGAFSPCSPPTLARSLSSPAPRSYRPLLPSLVIALSSLIVDLMPILTPFPTDDVLRARLKTVGCPSTRSRWRSPRAAKQAPSGASSTLGGVGVGAVRMAMGAPNRNAATLELTRFFFLFFLATWVPFFDDVDAIIFLAPIAGFDQVLAEDKTVNRLEDSVLLWKAVCSNKLLAGVDLVLFLNKCDILEKKLEGGVRLVRYVRSYADRENTFEAVSQYLRSEFSAIHREYSPNPRKFYAFLTSVTVRSPPLPFLFTWSAILMRTRAQDTATTGGIIASVRDMVVRQHLKQLKLL